jgi:hypothetical protein
LGANQIKTFRFFEVGPDKWRHKNREPDDLVPNEAARFAELGNNEQYGDCEQRIQRKYRVRNPVATETG